MDAAPSVKCKRPDNIVKALSNQQYHFLVLSLLIDSDRTQAMFADKGSVAPAATGFPTI